MQQAGIQQNITGRGVQRAPITIKMAAPNASQLNELQLHFNTK